MFQEYHADFGSYVGGRRNGWYDHIISFSKNIREIGRELKIFSYDTVSGRLSIFREIEYLEFDVWWQGYAPHGYCGLTLYKSPHQLNPRDVQQGFDLETDNNGHLHKIQSASPGDYFYIGNRPAHIQVKPVLFSMTIKASLRKESIDIDPSQNLRDQLEEWIKTESYDEIKSHLGTLSDIELVRVRNPSNYDGSTLAESLRNLPNDIDAIARIRHELCLLRMNHANASDIVSASSSRCICGAFHSSIYQQEVNELKQLNYENDMKLVDCYGEVLHSRGVTVEWLAMFTENHQCMNWPTWRVVEYIIKPETQRLKCRYVELQSMTQSNVVGKTDVFISHCWCGSWGTLVASAVKKLSPKTRVWCDIFAVRQWAGSGCDLAFQEVVKRSKGVLLVVSSFPQTNKFNHIFLRSSHIYDLINAEDRKKIPFLRVWCLVELHAAISNNIPIMPISGNILPGTLELSENISLLYKLQYLVDISAAEATVPDDISTILEMIKSTIGLEIANRQIRGAIIGALLSVECPEVALAALGQLENWQQKLEDNKDNLAWLSVAARVAASSGFSYILKEILDINPSKASEIACSVDETKKSVIMYSAEGGHDACIRMLVEYGANLKAQDNSGLTVLCYGAQALSKDLVLYLIEAGADLLSQIRAPLAFAAIFDNYPMCEALIAANVDLNFRDPELGYTALKESIFYGHLNIAKLLLDHGADINAKDNWDCTILGWAIKGCKNVTQIVSFVLEHGAIKDEKSIKLAHLLRTPHFKKDVFELLQIEMPASGEESNTKEQVSSEGTEK